MADSPTGHQSGGINIHESTVNTGGGDMVGHDKIVAQGATSRQLEDALRPLVEAIKGAPPDKQAEALAKVEALKLEAAKGQKRDDGAVAKLIEGLVGLVPGAVTAVVSAFATPILGGITGPVTKYVLDKIQGK
jgi:hypothetical protein